MKISASQFFWILGCSPLYQALNPALIVAGRDAWIVVALSGLMTFAVTFLIVKAAQTFRGKNIIEHSQDIFGKWIGTIVVVPYLGVWLLWTVIGFQELNQIVTLTLLPRTPVLVVVSFMAVLTLYVNVKGGITLIGRCSQVVGPLVLLFNLLPLIMPPYSPQLRYLLPVYVDTGWHGIIQSAIPCSVYLAQTITIPLVLVTFMSNPSQVMSRALWSFGIGATWAFLASIFCVAAFSSEVTSLTVMPWFSYIKSISIMDFVQGFDIMALVTLLLAQFIWLSTNLFVAGYTVAMWMKALNWKYVISAFLVVIMVWVLRTSDVALSAEFYRQFMVKWMFPVTAVGIPLILWVGGVIKHSRAS